MFLIVNFLYFVSKNAYVMSGWLFGLVPFVKIRGSLQISSGAMSLCANIKVKLQIPISCLLLENSFDLNENEMRYSKV